jgi:hypothetical protein
MQTRGLELLWKSSLALHHLEIRYDVKKEELWLQCGPENDVNFTWKMRAKEGKVHAFKSSDYRGNNNKFLVS